MSTDDKSARDHSFMVSPCNSAHCTKPELQEAIDALPFYVIIVDDKHTIVMVNTVVGKILGLDPKEIIGGHCPKVVHGVDGSFPGCPLEEAVETKSAVEREIFDAKSGRWLKSAIYPINVKGSDRRNSQRLFFHMTQDITVQKKAQEQIQRLSAFPESNPNPVFEFLPDGTISYRNQASYKVAETFEKKLPEEILPSNYEEIVRECFRTKENKRHIDVRFNGRTVSWSFYPIEETNAVHCYGSEITDLKQLEQQLMQSQKMEAIGNLAGGIAHDFNNILTVISGTLDLIMFKSDESNPFHQDFKQVKDASIRAAALTRQLLLYSRKHHMEVALLDINNTIKSLLKMLIRLIGENVAIHPELEKDVWMINGDKGNLEQMLMNLVINARDAMSKGGEITIKTENITVTKGFSKPIPDTCSYGRYVLIAVSDTGMGMDKATQEHIFEPFYTTKGPGKGTGLGMSVVYGIVKEHGGWIEVNSEPGNGTEISVYIPATMESHRTREETDSEKTAIMDLKGNGEQILLVEDEDSVRWTTKKILEESGYSVIAASNAQQASEIFQREYQSFALVFTDVVLPDKNGLELIGELRIIRSDLKFLLSSGYTGDKTQGHMIKQNKYPFIQKPYDLNKLLTIIKECIT